jgi:hypothetical protein
MSNTNVLRALLVTIASLLSGTAYCQQPNVYADVVDHAPFDQVRQRMEQDKGKIVAAHRKLLEERYDLADRPSAAVKMSRG